MTHKGIQSAADNSQTVCIDNRICDRIIVFNFIVYIFIHYAFTLQKSKISNSIGLTLHGSITNPGKVPMGLKKKILFVSLTLLLMLGSLEFSLYILSLSFPKLDALLSHTQEPHRPDDKLWRRPHPGYPEHDKKGFRNSSYPEQVRIVAIGDSQTYGGNVAPDKPWSQQLEAMSRIKTYNMAWGGYGPVQYYALLDEAFELEPDLIIVAFYAGNDIFDAFFFSYSDELNPIFKTKDQSILAAIERAEREDPIRDKMKKLFLANPNRPPDPPKDNTWRHFLAEHSKINGLAGAAIRTWNRELGAMGAKEYTSDNSEINWNEVVRVSESNHDYCKIFDSGNMRTVFRSRHVLCGVDLSDPRIREGQRITLDAIRRIKEKTEKEKVGFAILWIPTKEMVFKKYVTEGTIKDFDLFESVTKYESEIARTVQNFANHEGIPFFDPLPHLVEYLDRGEQPFWINFDGHLNPIGQKAVAETVLEGIKKHKLMGSEPVPTIGVSKTQP